MLVSLLHGLFAASGVMLILLFATGHPEESFVTSMVLFGIAAVGGIILFARDMMNRSLPGPLVIVRAGIALLSFAVLLIAAFA